MNTLLDLRVLLFSAAFSYLLPLAAYADRSLYLPSSISCAYGSVSIRRTGPILEEGITRTAAYTLTVGGITEAATGIEHGNYSKVVSKTYYVFGGTGGLTFAKNNAGKAICTNSKYGATSPGFEYK